MKVKILSSELAADFEQQVGDVVTVGDKQGIELVEVGAVEPTDKTEYDKAFKKYGSQRHHKIEDATVASPKGENISNIQTNNAYIPAGVPRDTQILINRLREAGLPTRRFLKVGEDKAAFEDAFQEHLYDVEDLTSYPRWGIIGGHGGLALLDADNASLEGRLRSALPPTFEVLTPTRKLSHFYIIVTGDKKVPSKKLFLPDSIKSCGELRADQYLVAPGTTISTGMYRVRQDRPIAKMSFEDFENAIRPFLVGAGGGEKLSDEKIEFGTTTGDRHNIGIKYAGVLIGKQKLDAIAALEAMKIWNKHNVPPLPEKELKRMVEYCVKAQPKSETAIEQLGGDLIAEMRASDTFADITKFLEKTVKSDPRYIHNVLVCGISAYTPDPINCASEAPTSTGKTYGFTEVLRLFPKKDVLMMGGLSPKALIHQRAKLYDENNNDQTATLNAMTAELAELKAAKGKKKDDVLIEQKKKELSAFMNKGKWIINLENTILVFLESPSLETFMMLRPLMSHDTFETEYDYVDKQTLRTRKVFLRGWPLVFYAKAGRGKEDYIWDELKTRSILITPTMSATKYRAGVTLVSQRKGLPGAVSDDVLGLYDEAGIKRKIELIKAKLLGITKEAIVSTGKADVNCFWTPFYREVGAEFPANVAKHMRDAKRFFSMINMSAAINVYARPTIEIDGVNYIITLPEDYERAKRIFFEETGLEIFSGVPSHILKLFDEVIVPLCAGMPEQGEQQTLMIETDKKKWREVKTREIVDKSGLPSNTLRQWYLSVLESAGMISSDQDSDNKSGKVWRILKLKPTVEIAPTRTLFGVGGIFTLETLKERENELKSSHPKKSQREIVTHTIDDKAINIEELFELYFSKGTKSGGLEPLDLTPQTKENTPKKQPTEQKGENGVLVSPKSKSCDICGEPTEAIVVATDGTALCPKCSKDYVGRL